MATSPDGFSALLRQAMSERSLSLRALARQIPIDPGQLSRVLNGMRPPTPSLAQRCDEIFDSAPLLAQAAERSRTIRRQLPPAARSTRNGVEQSCGIATGAAGDPGGSAKRIAATERVPPARREVGPETLSALNQAITALRRLDDEVGAGHVVEVAAAQLRSVTTLRARADGQGRRDLSRAVAELAQLSGWLYFDLDQLDTARQHLELAQHAATEADDPLLASYALSWQSLVVSQAHPSLGRSLALAAQHQAGADAPDSVRAWLFRVEAEAAAAQGDHQETERALGALEELADAPRTERDPGWTYFVEPGQMAAYRGVCQVRLKRGHHAVAALDTALEQLPRQFVRDRGLYLTYSAAAHLQRRDPEAAATAAIQALHQVLGSGSTRTLGRIRRLRRALEPWSRLSAVRRLDEELRAGLYSAG